MKKILVIDGNSIINRAYYGMRPLTTKSGKTTHAIYGMINIISRQISAIKPDYTAVAFDLKAPTFRHKMYDGYKATRHPSPEDLISQFPDAKECLRLMGIHVLELPGYEADDIQGTVAKMAHCQADTHGYVLSGDRDLLQLIDEKVTVLLATTGDTKVMDGERFKEEYGVDPCQFVDMKALMGDSSDNIPGVGGIGQKTAKTLIENFGTLEGIYENIDDKRISKGVREKLLRDRDNAFMSRYGNDRNIPRYGSSTRERNHIGEFALEHQKANGVGRVQLHIPCIRIQSKEWCDDHKRNRSNSSQKNLRSIPTRIRSAENRSPTQRRGHPKTRRTISVV